MRITNAMLVNSFMSDLNTNMTVMSTYQNQLATGRRMNKISDDPVGLLSVLSARSKLNKVTTNTAAVDDARSWLDQNESSINEINEVVNVAYENAIRASNGTMDETDRDSIATLIEQMKEHVVQLGNTTYGDRYIFGGYNTTQPPFTVDSGTGKLLYNGKPLDSLTAADIADFQSQHISYSTGEGVDTQVSFTGIDLLGSGAGNLYNVLDDLQKKLADPASTTDQILASLPDLMSQQQNLLSRIAEVGGKQNRLNVMQTSLDSNDINYSTLLSKNEDIDQAEVTMQFKMAEAIYRASLDVGSRVIQPSLVDFMR